MMMVRNESLTEQGITMNALTGLVRPIVEDRTGLTGKYDVSLQWSRDEIADTGKEMTDASVKPSLFTALQDQLRLRLDATKGPEDTVVVDHVEVPSEN
jgi:uncharacterized protein (TIGR03435 family)